MLGTKSFEIPVPFMIAVQSASQLIPYEGIKKRAKISNIRQWLINLVPPKASIFKYEL